MVGLILLRQLKRLKAGFKGSRGRGSKELLSYYCGNQRGLHNLIKHVFLSFRASEARHGIQFYQAVFGFYRIRYWAG